MRIFRTGSSEMIFWKHHLAEHFVAGTAPISDNGVGKGGHLFVDFDDMVKRIGRTMYWVVPVRMSRGQYVDCGNGMVEAKVTKLGMGDFAPVSYWEGHRP